MMEPTPTQSQLTTKFLKTLADRLCSRTKLKDVEYEVEIGEDYVHMNPLVYVFPNTRHRKDSDKTSILSYLVNKIFVEISTNGEIVNDSIKIQPNKLVTGKYEYQFCDLTGRRRWVRQKQEKA